MKRKAWLVVALALGALLLYFGVWVAMRPRIIDTKMDRARYDVELFADVLEEYRKEQGRYPTTEEGLGELVRVGFIRKVPIDPWSRAYEYRFPGSRNSEKFDVWTYVLMENREGATPTKTSATGPPQENRE